MNYKMYSIFDTKSRVYAQPWFSVNDATAIRSFSQVANDPSTQIFHHPEDFILYQIGHFSDDSGVCMATTPPVHLGAASNFKREDTQIPLPLSMKGNSQHENA